MNTRLFAYYLVDHCNNLSSLTFQTHASILVISYVRVYTHIYATDILLKWCMMTRQC